MGLSMQIKCPTCEFTTGGRLGMGEEGLGGAYQDFAQRELQDECPTHDPKAPWKFTHSPEWQAIEDGHYQ